MAQELITKDNEIIDEVGQPHLYENITIKQLSNNYNIYINKMSSEVSDISKVIDINELNNIEKLIISFKERLSGAIVAEKKKSDSAVAKDKFLTILSKLPGLSSILEDKIDNIDKHKKNSRTSKEILKEMFDEFSRGGKTLKDSFSRAYDLKKILIEKESSLEIFSDQIKYIVLNVKNPVDKMTAIQLGGMIEAAKLNNKDKIYNKLNFILDFIEEQLTNIALLMPGIEAGLTEDSEISDYLQASMKMNNSFKLLAELSNQISRDGNSRILKLIKEVNETSTNNIDIGHMKKLAITNKEFAIAMTEGTRKKLESNVSTYKNMLEISNDLDKNITYYNEKTKSVIENANINISNFKEKN